VKGVTALEGGVGGLEGTINDLEGTVDGVKTTVSGVQTTVGEVTGKLTSQCGSLKETVTNANALTQRRLRTHRRPQPGARRIPAETPGTHQTPTC
jgi:hypothetical protein